MNNKRNLKLFWLAQVLALGFVLRIAGIWRPEPVDYHPDEHVIAKPVLQLAEDGQVGLKTHYRWPACGLIYPLGYTLYALKGVFGGYSYNAILIVQRVISAVAGTLSILMTYLLLRKLAHGRGSLLASVLVSVAQLPVLVGHYGTLDSLVALAFLVIAYLSYDVFDVSESKSNELNLGHCYLFGAVWGWGIATKWPMLLAALPALVGLVLSACHKPGAVRWLHFVTINAKRLLFIGIVGLTSWLASIPDVQMAPDKVLDSLRYETLHHKSGHYGAMGPGSFLETCARTVRDISQSGSVVAFVACVVGIAMCIRRPSRHGVFLLTIIAGGLIVVGRNAVVFDRHYLIAFSLLLAVVGEVFAGFVAGRTGVARYVGVIACVFLPAAMLLYTLICISPFWKPDARLLCSEWIKGNLPRGSGVQWAPRTHKWMLPGKTVAPDLFRMFPRRAKEGQTQYVLAAPLMMETFKRHPPSRPLVPAEWFPEDPPSMEDLHVYDELNGGGGPRLAFVREFSQKPSFMGLDLRLFGRNPYTDTTLANCSVMLFRIRNGGDVRREDSNRQEH